MPCEERVNFVNEYEIKKNELYDELYYLLYLSNGTIIYDDIFNMSYFERIKYRNVILKIEKQKNKVKGESFG